MRVLLIIIALLQIWVTIAQGKLLKGFGFKTGLVVANQDFDYTNPDLSLDTKSRVGFDLGGFVEWFDLPYLSILTEAHYIQKGMVIEVEKTNVYGGHIGTIKFDYRVDYLSVSALGKFEVGGKFISPYLIAGSRFDFLLGSVTDGNDELYDNFKSTVMGGDIGIGLEFNPINFPTILTEFRYSHDFSKAYKADLLQVKNRSFEILVGLKLKD